METGGVFEMFHGGQNLWLRLPREPGVVLILGAGGKLCWVHLLYCVIAVSSRR